MGYMTSTIVRIHVLILTISGTRQDTMVVFPTRRLEQLAATVGFQNKWVHFNNTEAVGC
jgi:hypothetical protein